VSSKCLSQPVGELELSVRGMRVLEAARIDTVGELDICKNLPHVRRNPMERRFPTAVFFYFTLWIRKGLL